MNNDKDKLISVVCDNEGTSFEQRRAIDLLLEDDKLLDRWRRYHLYKDVLRGESMPVGATELRDRVMRSLEDDPVDIKNPGRRNLQRRQNWKKLGAQLLLGVSVAGMLVVGLLPYHQGILSLRSLVSPVRVSSGPHSTAYNGHRSITQVQLSRDSDSSDTLNNYMFTHTAQNGTGSLLPYARMASYTYGYRHR